MPPSPESTSDEQEKNTLTKHIVELRLFLKQARNTMREERGNRRARTTFGGEDFIGAHLQSTFRSRVFASSRDCGSFALLFASLLVSSLSTFPRHSCKIKSVPPLVVTRSTNYDETITRVHSSVIAIKTHLVSECLVVTKLRCARSWLTADNLLPLSDKDLISRLRPGNISRDANDRKCTVRERAIIRD